jgi:hypothetical protein
MKKEMFVCEKCGGTNIEIKVWIDPNTREHLYDADEPAWCEDCEKNVRIIPKSEYVRSE